MSRCSNSLMVKLVVCGLQEGEDLSFSMVKTLLVMHCESGLYKMVALSDPLNCKFAKILADRLVLIHQGVVESRFERKELSSATDFAG